MRKAARSPQPAARSPQPAARSPQPAARSPQPAARSPQPAARSPQPAARSPQPAARSPQPAARSPQPAARSPQPAARSPQPAARSPQPAARSPQPAARSPQPAARSPQPAARSPQLGGSGRRRPAAARGPGGAPYLFAARRFAPPGDGELWLGDCLDVMSAMPDGSVRLVVTSPPYNIKNSSGNGLKNGAGGKWPKAALQAGYAGHGDAMPHGEYVAWQRKCLAEMLRLLRPDGAIFYNHKWRVQHGLLQDRSDIVAGFPVRQIVVWKRAGGINFNPRLLPAQLRGRLPHREAGVPARAGRRTRAGCVWEIAQESRNPHPAPFPVDLAERCIASVYGRRPRAASGPVLDPFMGSGTTAVAAARLGVRWIGIEKSAEYVAMSVKRAGAGGTRSGRSGRQGDRKTRTGDHEARTQDRAAPAGGRAAPAGGRTTRAHPVTDEELFRRLREAFALWLDRHPRRAGLARHGRAREAAPAAPRFPRPAAARTSERRRMARPIPQRRPVGAADALRQHGRTRGLPGAAAPPVRASARRRRRVVHPHDPGRVRQGFPRPERRRADRVAQPRRRRPRAAAVDTSRPRGVVRAQASPPRRRLRRSTEAVARGALPWRRRLPRTAPRRFRGRRSPTGAWPSSSTPRRVATAACATTASASACRSGICLTSTTVASPCSIMPGGTAVPAWRPRLRGRRSRQAIASRSCRRQRTAGQLSMRIDQPSSPR